MALIVDIRGVNGSGKTTLIKDFIGSAETTQHCLIKPQYADNPTEVCGTSFKYDRLSCVVLGRYDKPSGGCDATHRQEQICERVRFFAPRHAVVLFEGVIVATIAQRYINLALEMKEMGHRYIPAYLNTSIEQCIENIANRRITSPVVRKPFNIELLKKKHESILATRPKFEAADIPTLTLTYPHGVKDLRHAVDSWVQSLVPG